MVLSGDLLVVVKREERNEDAGVAGTDGRCDS